MSSSNGEKPSTKEMKESFFKAFITKLRKRRLVETLAAFIGGGWLLLEFVHWLLVDHYHFPEKTIDVTFITILGALLSTIIWRWFSSSEKRSGNVKPEVLLVPLIILTALAVDLNLGFDIAGISGKRLLVSIIAFLLGISWIIFKSLQWAAQASGMQERDFSASPRGETRPEKSILVLPFVNIGPEQGQEYFCDGITEEIITDLSNIQNLRVISRTSAMLLKESPKPIREIAKELDVQYVLEGSVRKAGNDLRIAAQLIDARNDAHLWAEKLSGTLDDVLAMQEKVSRSIVDTLKLKLMPADEQATTRSAEKPNRKKLLIPAAGLVVIIVATIVIWPKASNLDPKLVAVAVFENKTGDPKLDYIGSMAAERIMQGLAQVGQFSVAPMPPTEALAAEARSKDRLRALAELTKAGKIVHGDYYLQGETVQFHAWVQDMAAKKNIVLLEPASGPAADPDAALEPLRLKLMGGLAGVFDPEIKEYISSLKEPPNLEAFREYNEGLKAFNRFDYKRAIENFLKAADRDPGLRAALIYAAVAYCNQGERANAEELAQNVEKSRADLSSGERFALDWLQALIRRDYETMLRLDRQIVSDIGAQVWVYVNGLDATRNNYPAEAVTVLSRYDPYSPARKDRSSSYWGVLTTAHHMLGNHKRELKEARRGRKQFPENLIMLACEVDALAALGRTNDLQKLFEESRSLPPQSGYFPGSIMLAAGRELRAHGFREESVRVLNQALKWHDDRPSEEKGSVSNRYIQASTLYVLERWDEAETLFVGLHSDVPENINYLGYLGAVAARRGEIEEALKVSKEIEENKRPYLFGNPTYWRARIAALLGDKEGAVNLLRQATTQGYAYSNIHPTEDFESLADYPPYVQLMKPKG